jgi:hypothetical protein
VTLLFLRWYYTCTDCGAYTFADELPGWPFVDGEIFHGKRYRERTVAARLFGESC